VKKVMQKCACCDKVVAFTILNVRRLFFGFAIDAECPKGHWVHQYMRRAP
jgi:hypothetical protein